MAIGDRIRIVTEKEYRIMSPPRRPKKESPQTTIRWQRRQMATMEARIAILTRELDSKTELAAELDRRASEIPQHLSDIHKIYEELADANDTIDRMTVQSLHHRRDIRLSFLEGYYDKSQELLPHDPTQAHRRSGAGNQENLPDGAPRSEEEGIEAAPGRTGGGPRGEIRGFRPGNPAYTNGRPMAESEIGIPHDATRSELARHRR